jgi:hypothetical protein
MLKQYLKYLLSPYERSKQKISYLYSVYHELAVFGYWAKSKKEARQNFIHHRKMFISKLN